MSIPRRTSLSFAEYRLVLSGLFMLNNIAGKVLQKLSIYTINGLKILLNQTALLIAKDRALESVDR